MVVKQKPANRKPSLIEISHSAQAEHTQLYLFLALAVVPLGHSVLAEEKIILTFVIMAAKIILIAVMDGSVVVSIVYLCLNCSTDLRANVNVDIDLLIKRYPLLLYLIVPDSFMRHIGRSQERTDNPS